MCSSCDSHASCECECLNLKLLEYKPIIFFGLKFIKEICYCPDCEHLVIFQHEYKGSDRMRDEY